MTNYDDEQRAMDVMASYQKSGLVMQTVGWTLVLFAFITAVYIFVSWRSGSMFWIWWNLGLVVLGAGLIVWGSKRRSRAAKVFTARTMAVPAAPSVKSAEERRDKGGPTAA